ncbi:MAG: hypothetical protein ACPGVF_04145 [Flavobacteriaceae bacterium]
MKTNKTNPFKVPTKYFKELEVSLLKQTRTKLYAPFQVPEAYFESLEKHILQKTIPAPKAESNFSFYAIAAVFMVLIMSFFWIQYTNVDPISDEVLEWVLLEEMNTYELASYVETPATLNALENTEAIDIDFLDYSFDFNETNTYENSID